MTKDEIMQLVIEAADSIYNKDIDLANKSLSQIYAEILNNFEKLLTEVLYRMQNLDTDD